MRGFREPVDFKRMSASASFLSSLSFSLSAVFLSPLAAHGKRAHAIRHREGRRERFGRKEEKRDIYMNFPFHIRD
jgi:hypothetical protein